MPSTDLCRALGESAELVHEILPAGEVVRRIAAEADEVLARVGR